MQRGFPVDAAQDALEKDGVHGPGLCQNLEQGSADQCQFPDFLLQRVNAPLHVAGPVKEEPRVPSPSPPMGVHGGSPPYRIIEQEAPDAHPNPLSFPDTETGRVLSLVIPQSPAAGEVD